MHQRICGEVGHGKFISIVASAFTIAVAAISIDIYQWRAALPFWVDEEMIALNLRDRSMADLAGPLWLGQSAPFGGPFWNASPWP